MKAVTKFSYIVVDGIGYFEPEDKMTYDEAIKWCKIRGLRLLTRGEWSELWDTKEEFRKSCQDVIYWTASVYPNLGYVWGFFGDDGGVYYYSRDCSTTIRAVLAESDGPHNY